MELPGKNLNGCRIGLFGRGGSGKSTCTVMLARALKQAGYPVCVLDADSRMKACPKRWAPIAHRHHCSVSALERMTRDGSLVPA